MVTFCGEIRKDRMVCSILFHHSYTESARANSALRAIPIGATLLSATMKIFLIRHMHMYDSEFNGAPHCAQAMGPSARCRACFPGLSRVSLSFPGHLFCFWSGALFLLGSRIFCFPVSGTASGALCFDLLFPPEPWALQAFAPFYLLFFPGRRPFFYCAPF